MAEYQRALAVYEGRAAPTEATPAEETSHEGDTLPLATAQETRSPTGATPSAGEEAAKRLGASPVKPAAEGTAKDLETGPVDEAVPSRNKLSQFAFTA